MSTLTRRVELLEEKVDALAELPPRMTRVEERLVSVDGRLTRVEERLVSVEGRLTTVEEELGALRGEMRGEFARVREEARAGDEETRHQMRILHEDVLARFALVQEGIGRINGAAKQRGLPRHRK